MKQSILITLLGLAMSAAVMAADFRHPYENGGNWDGIPEAASADIASDASQWFRAQLVWNEEYDAYDVLPVLEEDVFQERLVWSDRHADFVSRGMALRAAYEEKIWSDRHDFYVARGEVEPCIRLSQQPPLKVARRD
jgi:hypothetical protein